MAPENSNWLSFSLSSMDNPADSDSCYSFSDNFYAAEAAYMQQPPPKLEDFFAGGGGDSAGTQDSSLTNMYFGDEHHQDLKAVFGAGPFSATSASEVDDSPFSVRRNLSPAGTGNFNSTETTLAVAAPDSESCKKTGDTFSQRTSIYRGVTRHRWTGRYEAHLWDNSCRREGQARKGRQVYLGGYDKEDKAAHAYDLAALKYWGPTATTNFPLESYSKEIEAMANVTKQEFIASLRRKSSGFSRGASIYRGVTRHHQQGKWQARIGRVAGNKDLYLGTFGTEEEAAEAYDIAAIKFRGLNAVTNFEMSRYDIEAIANSPLPVGGTSKRSKPSREAQEKPTTTAALQTTSFSFASNQPAPPVPISCGVPLDSFTPFGNYHHLYNPAAASDASTVNEFFVWPHQSY